MQLKSKNSSNPRDLTVKTYLNPDEFLSFRDKCTATGIKVATRIRQLIISDSEPAHRINSDRRRERPKLGPVRMQFPASRARGGAQVVRMRL